MQTEPRDQSIEQIEADLRESRFTKWDVETFLENRHKAKIERLQKPKGRWALYWEVFRDLAVFVLAYFGFAVLMAMLGGWLLTGAWPSLLVVS
ncbi:MAG: hypothetical protein AAGF20_06750 [Pseudomonadota bacterium]